MIHSPSFAASWLFFAHPLISALAGAAAEAPLQRRRNAYGSLTHTLSSAGSRLPQASTFKLRFVARGYKQDAPDDEENLCGISGSERHAAHGHRHRSSKSSSSSSSSIGGRMQRDRVWEGGGGVVRFSCEILYESKTKAREGSVSRTRESLSCPKGSEKRASKVRRERVKSASGVPSHS